MPKRIFTRTNIIIFGVIVVLPMLYIAYDAARAGAKRASSVDDAGRGGHDLDDRSRRGVDELQLPAVLAREPSPGAGAGDGRLLALIVGAEGYAAARRDVKRVDTLKLRVGCRGLEDDRAALVRVEDLALEETASDPPTASSEVDVLVNG